jgi:hypothetical protein
MLNASAGRSIESASLLSRRPHSDVQLLHACVLLLYLVDSALQLLRGPIRVNGTELTGLGT